MERRSSYETGDKSLYHLNFLPRADKRVINLIRSRINANQQWFIEGRDMEDEDTHG